MFTVLIFGPVLCFDFKYRTQRVPELIPKPTLAQLLDETTTRRIYIYGIQDDNGTDVQNFSLDLTPPPDVIMKTSPGTSEGMNVLGIVIFSATMGKWFPWILYTHLHSIHTYMCIIAWLSLGTPLHNLVIYMLCSQEEGRETICLSVYTVDHCCYMMDEFFNNICCVFFFNPGIMLGRMGPNGSALVNFCQSLNEAVLKIVAIVIWYENKVMGFCWYLKWQSKVLLKLHEDLLIFFNEAQHSYHSP